MNDKKLRRSCVVLDEESLEVYDEEAKARGVSRSGFLRLHAREIRGLRVDSQGSIAIGILGVLLVIGLVVFGLAVLPGLIGPGVAPPADQWEFNVLPSVDTTGGDTIPSGSYDSCDVEAGGTTGEWTATEGTYDPAARQFTARIGIDTDLATTAALWMEPNCLTIRFDVSLARGPDDDLGSYWVRIAAISRTLLRSDGTNGTLNAWGIARDNGAGGSESGDFYLLYRTDASTWTAACSEFRAAPNLGNSCGWVRLGDHSGASAVDTVLAFILLEDRGYWGYQEPLPGDSVTIVYEFGSPDGRVKVQRFQVVIRLDSRGTTNLS